MSPRAKRVKKIKKPIKPIKKPLPGFDPDSYPIWVNPFNITFTKFSTISLQVVGPVATFRPNSTDPDGAYRLKLGLNLSSKVKLHGIALYYDVESTQCYINKVYLYEWIAVNGQTVQLYNENVTLNSTDRDEYWFKINDREINGSITLELWLEVKAKKDIHINAVKVMVKDV